MQPKSYRPVVVSVLAALAALVLVSGASSCATNGQGENQSFTDASPSDGTTGAEAAPEAAPPQDSGGGQCDADTTNDPSNCGACGNACPSGNTCSCGMCTPPCTGALQPCCGQCLDLSKDPNNCGMCGNACIAPSGGSVPGVPLCQGGACSFTCPKTAGGDGGGAIVQCGADAGAPGCYDFTSSAGACGGCGKACPSGDVCVDSMCCPSGDGICGGACTPLNTTTNCGACGVTCGTGAQCTGGKCVGYSITNPTVPFVDACALPGATTVLVSANSGWSYINLFNLPFSFSFYGTAQTQVWIQNQGTLGIGPDMLGFPFQTPDNYPDCNPQNADPTTGYPAAVAFGDSSMATGPLGVCYASTGGAGDAGVAGDAGDAGASPAQFVVTWEQATLQSDPGSILTVSIVLTQGTNTIDFQYQVAGGGDGGIDPQVGGVSASVGLQQGNGSKLFTPASCDKTFLKASPYDIRFTP